MGTPAEARRYTSNGGLLKQADKQELSSTEPVTVPILPARSNVKARVRSLTIHPNATLASMVVVEDQFEEKTRVR